MIGFAHGALDAAVGALAGIGFLVVGAAWIDPEPAAPMILACYGLAGGLGALAHLLVRAIKVLNTPKDIK